MTEKIPVSVCQKSLATIWFVGSLLIFVVVLMQTLGGKYGDEIERAWSWFLPTVMPMLGLIVGAVTYEAVRPQTTATVDRFVFRTSVWFSLFYLLLVLLTLILQPLTRMTPLKLMNISNLWLGPVQGLVGVALGVFFGSRQTGGTGLRK
jgi:hypothetical protein